VFISWLQLPGLQVVGFSLLELGRRERGEIQPLALLQSLLFAWQDGMWNEPAGSCAETYQARSAGTDPLALPLGLGVFYPGYTTPECGRSTQRVCSLLRVIVGVAEMAEPESRATVLVSCPCDVQHHRAAERHGSAEPAVGGSAGTVIREVQMMPLDSFSRWSLLTRAG